MHIRKEIQKLIKNYNSKKAMTDEILKWILILFGIIIVMVVLSKISGSLRSPVKKLSEAAGSII